MAVAAPKEVIAFWREAGADRWFKSDPAFDAEISERFLETHEAAAAGKLNDWRFSADGALALTLLLDQFPRNMFRGTPRAFASDGLALDTAKHAIGAGYDHKVAPELQTFFYMPFMHSEELAEQDRCVDLMAKEGNQENIKYAELHRDAIRRFGRFPHRNGILGRISTPEEIAYLEGGGFAG
jgi:uncharacterized protein (DUF924 family)